VIEIQNQNKLESNYLAGCNEWLSTKESIKEKIGQPSADMFVDFFPYRLLGGYAQIKSFLQENQFVSRINEIKVFINKREEIGKKTYCLSSIAKDLALDSLITIDFK
jgi:hypothetical protein